MKYEIWNKEVISFEKTLDSKVSVYDNDNFYYLIILFI